MGIIYEKLSYLTPQHIKKRISSPPFLRVAVKPYPWFVMIPNFRRDFFALIIASRSVLDIGVRVLTIFNLF